ncbi:MULTISPECIES: septation protein SepH [unclassified Modestobacter]|uniref:septation protein SepH n=1 Tax=unclassified Modestobacter TaxID=2643866 RepID=UPI0022AAE02F|nr:MULTISPECIES: septation protein SepH [unclassified Modestobacter]MCZ2825257.1 septation protein SepH [Modestobacter sp. VKM Ac-2981]MCZ2853678.1 septation protein SepH [Modestobacter sp. VKM Ac-2982]
MRSLRLVALSEDGAHLVLAADAPDSTDGEHFELPVDDRLRQLLRAGAAPQAPAEVAHDLPPRVIQARIRAGETPEQVAHASGTRVERIMRFAHPVLQERARVAEQARGARVRLSEGTPSVPLEQFMSERLRLLGADLEAVRWDAHRAEDGTWQVQADWEAGAKSGSTRWSYDLPARTVTPVDATTMDFAEGTRLVRVVPDVPAGLPAAPVTRRGISVLHDEEDGEVEAHADAGAAEDGAGEHDDEAQAAVTADPLPVDEVPDDDVALPGEERPADGPPRRSAYDAVDPDNQDTAVLGSLLDGETEDPRARIPAWEDIVFGVRRNR